MESFKYATFIVLAPCTNYTSLTDGDRSNSYVNIPGASWKCDRPWVTRWYRFSGAAGAKMSTIVLYLISVPLLVRCGLMATTQLCWME